MGIIRLELPEKELPCTGKSVSFLAPCDCTNAECIQIEGTNYSVVDAIGRVVTGKSGIWAKDALVTVILNCETQQAFIQNCAKPELAIADISGLGDALSVATTSKNGFMSKDDKQKLDGIAAGATKVTVTTSFSSSSDLPPTCRAVASYIGVVTSNYLKLDGTSKMTGNLNTHGIVLTEGVDYGSSLPDDAPIGKLFFLLQG